MTLRIALEKNRYATLLSVYAPTLPSDSESIDSFYHALDEALRWIQKSDKILLLGDFNARVGQWHMERSTWQAWDWSGQLKWHETT